MKNTNWTNKKDVVLAAVTQNGYALEYASEQLKNDLELLNLLYHFYNLTENKIEDANENFQKCFEERMKVREILFEQNLMQDSISVNNNFKPRVFKI